MVRKHDLDRTIAKKISGHLPDSMFERYNFIVVEDIKAAKKQVNDRSAWKGSTDGVPVASTVYAELLEIANSSGYSLSYTPSIAVGVTPDRYAKKAAHPSRP